MGPHAPLAAEGQRSCAVLAVGASPAPSLRAGRGGCSTAEKGADAMGSPTEPAALGLALPRLRPCPVTMATLRRRRADDAASVARRSRRDLVDPASSLHHHHTTPFAAATPARSAPPRRYKRCPGRLPLRASFNLPTCRVASAAIGHDAEWRLYHGGGPAGRGCWRTHR